MRYKDISGRAFGRVVVLEDAGTDAGMRRLWKCRCSCGAEFEAYGGNLRSGHTKSCGCLRIEKLTERNRAAARGA